MKQLAVPDISREDSVCACRNDTMRRRLVLARETLTNECCRRQIRRSFVNSPFAESIYQEKTGRNLAGYLGLSETELSELWREAELFEARAAGVQHEEGLEILDLPLPRPIFRKPGSLGLETVEHIRYYTWDHEQFMPGAAAAPYIQATGLSKEELHASGLTDESGKMRFKRRIPSYVVAFVKPGFVISSQGSMGGSLHPNVGGPNNVCLGGIEPPSFNDSKDVTEWLAMVLSCSTNTESPLTNPDTLLHVPPIGMKIRYNEEGAQWVDIPLGRKTAHLLTPAFCGRAVGILHHFIVPGESGLSTIEGKAKKISMCASCPMPCPVKMLGNSSKGHDRVRGLKKKNFNQMPDGRYANPASDSGAIAPMMMWHLDRMGLLTPTMEAALSAYRAMAIPGSSSQASLYTQKAQEEHDPRFAWVAKDCRLAWRIVRDFSPVHSQNRDDFVKALPEETRMALDFVSGGPGWRAGGRIMQELTNRIEVNGLSTSVADALRRLNRMSLTPSQKKAAGAIIKKSAAIADPHDESISLKKVKKKVLSTTTFNYTTNTHTHIGTR